MASLIHAKYFVIAFKKVMKFDYGRSYNQIFVSEKYRANK